MAHVKPIIRVELDPAQPVPEICAVISAVLPYHPDKEEEILKGIADAIDRRLTELKGDEKGGNHSESRRSQ